MKFFRDLLTEKEEEIEEKVREKYRALSAMGTRGLFNYPTGEEGLRKLGYPDDILSRIPVEVTMFFCGVGNPIKEATFSTKMRIMDMGCGAGVDAIIAAMVAGPDSEVVGIDMLHELVELAMMHARRAGVQNVSFIQSPADNLPFSDGHFDLLISNGLFNLVLQKERALSEWFRVLKKGGEAVIADMSLEEGVTAEDVKGKGAWSD